MDQEPMKEGDQIKVVIRSITKKDLDEVVLETNTDFGDSRYRHFVLVACEKPFLFGGVIKAISMEKHEKCLNIETARKELAGVSWCIEDMKSE